MITLLRRIEKWAQLEPEDSSSGLQKKTRNAESIGVCNRAYKIKSIRAFRSNKGMSSEISPRNSVLTHSLTSTSGSTSTSTVDDNSHYWTKWSETEQKIVKEFYHLLDLTPIHWSEEDNIYSTNFHLEGGDGVAPSNEAQSSGRDPHAIEGIRQLKDSSADIYDRYRTLKMNQMRRNTSSALLLPRIASGASIVSYYEPAFALGAMNILSEDTKDPLGLKGDLSGHLVLCGSDTDEYLFDSIMISSPTFQPAVLLKTIHKNTNFHDLEYGMENLQESLEGKLDGMKNFIRQNFERFVNAKISIDRVYEMMKVQVFQMQDNGLANITQLISQWSKALHTSIDLVMQSKEEIDILVKKLASIQRFKFLFRLPISLKNAIQSNQIDIAIADYQKGKSMMKVAQHQIQEDGHETLSRAWSSTE